MNKRHKTCSLKKNLCLPIDKISNINIDNQIHTNRSEYNNKNKKNLNITKLYFNDNLLIKILKKSKFKINSKNYLHVLNRKKNFINNRNASISRKNDSNNLSEKFRSIPGISKLRYLTDESINDILKREEKTNITSIPLNSDASIIEKNRRNKSENKSPFIINKKLSLSNYKMNNNFSKIKLNNKYKYLTLNKNNYKLKEKPKTKLINNKLYRNSSKRKTFTNIGNNFFIYNANLKVKNKKENINNYNNNNNFSSFLKKNKGNKYQNLYRTKYNVYKIISGNKSLSHQKTKLNKNYNRIISSEVCSRNINRKENIFDKNKSTFNDIEISKNYNLTNDNNGLSINLLLNNQIKQLLNRNSKVDRLLFKLENPADCFEENVYTLRAGDKYISLKNQIIKQKNKLWKMNYNNKKSLKVNESQMRRYIFKIYSDRNHKKNKY